jgi:hypothetical protein
MWGALSDERTQQKPPTRIFYTFESPLMWGLTSIYMYCFTDKLVENKILS